MPVFTSAFEIALFITSDFEKQTMHAFTQDKQTDRRQTTETVRNFSASYTWECQQGQDTMHICLFPSYSFFVKMTLEQAFSNYSKASKSHHNSNTYTQSFKYTNGETQHHRKQLERKLPNHSKQVHTTSERYNCN